MRRAVALFFCVILIFLSGCGNDSAVGAKGREVLNYDYMKAVWVSQFDMEAVYLSGGAPREVGEFRQLIRQMAENLVGAGFNTLIFQVRPYGDSIYPSEIYPSSAVAVGRVDGDFLYDPFEIVVAEAHSVGLSVQAWVNPLRLMRSEEMEKVSEEYAIGRWYRDGCDYVCEVDGRWYLDPAYREVRELIIDGVREILGRYDVDGVHLDDYFYPTADSYFDKAAYFDYLSRGGALELMDWRRENINLLVAGIYDAVKGYGDELLFGISPAGNFNTAYEEQCADIYTWCSEAGYIDYICPQAYFGFEHGSYDFRKVVETYRRMIKCDELRLIVGMTMAKAYDGYMGVEDRWAGVGRREWIEDRDILRRQFEYLMEVEECSGVAYFSYRFFFDPISGEAILETAEEREGLLAAMNGEK